MIFHIVYAAVGEVAGRQAFPTNGCLGVTNEIPLHLYWSSCSNTRRIVLCFHWLEPPTRNPADMWAHAATGINAARSQPDSEDPSETGDFRMKCAT
jgi:hypothetical protein